MRNIRAILRACSSRLSVQDSAQFKPQQHQQYRSYYHVSLQNETHEFGDKSKIIFSTDLEYAQPAAQIPTFRIMNTNGEILNSKYDSMINVDLAKRFHKGSFTFAYYEQSCFP